MRRWLRRWQCRFCKGWFPGTESKETDRFGQKCLPCSVRTNLVGKEQNNVH